MAERGTAANEHQSHHRRSVVERMFTKADTHGMTVRLRPPLVPAVVVCIAILASPLLAGARPRDPWRALADSITSASHADSAAVLVLFDQGVLDRLRSRLPKSLKTLLFKHPDVPRNDAFTRPQLGRLYRDALVETMRYPDLWVVGRRSGSTGRVQAVRFADMAASIFRRRILRDSLGTSEGTIESSRWVDVPGGAARRIDLVRAQAHAESVLAAGLPKPAPITRPFTRAELHIDPDTLSLYVARLADTSFYSIGGCSEVETIVWYAPERLANLGPGIVPLLVDRIADANPFLRERAEEALGIVTQDERIMARTGGEYLRFYDRPDVPPRDIVRAWWIKFGRYWTAADSTH